MPADKRAEVTNELLFETLKTIQGTLARHGEDLREIKDRIGHVEAQVGGLAMQYASLSNRIDRMDLRIERIERRPDLVGG
jgi:archaellum component FlaC